MKGNDQQLHKALDMARRALAVLEEQAAGYGTLEIPVNLRIQLEDKRREVAELAQTCLDMDMAQEQAQRNASEQQRRERHARQRVVNLRPLDMTHTFKDRVRELQACLQFLSDNDVRLISIVGRGGMGKTALASKILADLERGVVNLPDAEHSILIDGILYLSARTTGLSLERIYADLGRLLDETAAQRLALRWADKDTTLLAKVEYLLETMQEGRYLILLDNFEDETTAEGYIVDEGLRIFIECCLAQHSGLRLLMTSREQPQLPQAGLSSARQIVLREGLPEDEAMVLLRDLDPQGELGLQGAPEMELRQAAQRTQGIPRALEVLAGILYADPTTSLTELLDDATVFGTRVMETLGATGFQRLSTAERRVVEALAVYDRPIMETGIAFLLHPWYPGLEVRDVLRRLSKCYLVTCNRATREYSLHPLDREYAYRHLPENPHEPDGLAYSRRNLELRAAEYYAQIREPQSAWSTLDDLAPQLAEFEHRFRGVDYAGALAVIDSIDSGYMMVWGHYSWIIESRERLIGKTLPTRSTSSNFGQLGFAYYCTGNVKRSIEYFSKALDLANQIEDLEQKGVWFGKLGIAYHAQGRIAEACQFYEKALAISNQTNDALNSCLILSDLGNAYRGLGKFELATQSYKHGLVIARQIGHGIAENIHLGGLASAYSALGRFNTAIALYEIALNTADRLNDRRRVGMWLGNSGLAYLAIGQTPRAADLFQEAARVAQEIGDRRREAIWLGNIAKIHVIHGSLSEAYRLYARSLDIMEEVGDDRGKTYQLLGLGQLLLIQKEYQGAQKYLERALTLDSPTLNCRVLLLLGLAVFDRCTDCSRLYFTDSLKCSQALLSNGNELYDLRYGLGTTCVFQAICSYSWSDPVSRIELLRPALEEYRRALAITAAPGVVQDALCDLELIRVAGIEGLESIFELLQNAEYIPDTADDLDDLLGPLSLLED